MQCCLKACMQSNMTPRYLGIRQCSSSSSYCVTSSSYLAFLLLRWKPLASVLVWFGLEVVCFIVERKSFYGLCQFLFHFLKLIPWAATMVLSAYINCWVVSDFDGLYRYYTVLVQGHFLEAGYASDSSISISSSRGRQRTFCCAGRCQSTMSAGSPLSHCKLFSAVSVNSQSCMQQLDQ